MKEILTRVMNALEATEDRNAREETETGEVKDIPSKVEKCVQDALNTRPAFDVKNTIDPAGLANLITPLLIERIIENLPTAENLQLAVNEGSKKIKQAGRETANEIQNASVISAQTIKDAVRENQNRVLRFVRFASWAHFLLYGILPFILMGICLTGWYVEWQKNNEAEKLMRGYSKFFNELEEDYPNQFKKVEEKLKRANSAK